MNHCQAKNKCRLDEQFVIRFMSHLLQLQLFQPDVDQQISIKMT